MERVQHHGARIENNLGTARVLRHKHKLAEFGRAVAPRRAHANLGIGGAAVVLVNDPPQGSIVFK